MLKKNGMGNQMFSYAYARYLQECYTKRDGDEGIAIDPQAFNEKSAVDPYIDIRDLSLCHLTLNQKVCYLNLSEQIDCQRKKVRQMRRALGALGLFAERALHWENESERSYLRRSQKGVYLSYRPKAYYPTVLSKTKDKFVIGNFQDRRYFEPIRSILCEEFTVRTPASEQNQAMMEQIQNCNAVCLHIRRGDYLNPYWAKLNICDERYYQRAVDVMLQSVEDPVFFVFSNTHEDLLWIQENYHLVNTATAETIPVVYVDLSNPDYEEFRLMRACRHFIISNSTFSWWAAYLADETSVVCAPDRWDLTIERDAAMNCPKWKVIDTENNPPI